MDATLCDTVGSQIASGKRNKGVAAASALPAALAKIAAKPPAPPPPAVLRPNGDFTATAGADGRTLPNSHVTLISATPTLTSVTPAAVSPTSAPEVKPLLVVNGDLVSSSVHPASVVPSPPFTSSPGLTETASACRPHLNAPRFISRKAPPYSAGVLPFRLGTNHSPLPLSSSFSAASSCLASSSPVSAAPRSEGPKANEDPSGAALFREILKRQEEQAYLDRVARRRVEAREKRRERREVRMAESLGRVATAMELLSSKQDTVIALLQRLADRK